MVRNSLPPGPNIRKNRRGGFSEYGKQMKEKQRLRIFYGLREKQFSNYVHKALAKKDVDKSEFLVRNLETRLDNVIYRLGLAKSRVQGRQIVNHGHVLVNGKKVSIPSFSVKPNDVIELKPAFKGSPLIESQKAMIKKVNQPSWLNLDKETFEGKVINYPDQNDMEELGRVQSILEFYSR